MNIIKAKLEDINELVKVYEIAVNHMFEENNSNQWKKDPTNFINGITKYINNSDFYIVLDNNEIVGFFAMIFGIDDTYNEIDGKWINNDPYVTIHKIASKYYKRHIASFILEYVINEALKRNIHNIRIDTYKDNISMQAFLNKKGFIKCGIISIRYDFNDIDSHRLAFIKTI